MDIAAEIELATGLSIAETRSLGHGRVGQVVQIVTGDGRQFVAKVDNGNEPGLDLEGFMLKFLSENSDLPVPQPVFVSPQLLVMTHLPGESSFSSSAQEHAAELLAALHSNTSIAYGFDRPTLIGGLHQPNDWSDSWISFFAEQRLLHMAEQGAKAGRLPAHIAQRIERIAANLTNWLEEPQAPALVHGDVWTGNVLSCADKISGFIDPSIYYAAPEVELAFVTLFSTFGEPFFRRYQEIRAISPGFFAAQRDIYNLYPLLVHVRLFGGGYVSSVENTLRRFGY